ncbi:MAG: hypothetical protein ABI396_04570, partial [Ktedonobacteraceae bacterium]
MYSRGDPCGRPGHHLQALSSIRVVTTKVPHAIWTATLFVSACHLGEVEGCYERYTADDVANQR